MGTECSLLPDEKLFERQFTGHNKAPRFELTWNWMDFWKTKIQNQEKQFESSKTIMYINYLIKNVLCQISFLSFPFFFFILSDVWRFWASSWRSSCVVVIRPRARARSLFIDKVDQVNGWNDRAQRCAYGNNKKFRFKERTSTGIHQRE